MPANSICRTFEFLRSNLTPFNPLPAVDQTKMAAKVDSPKLRKRAVAAKDATKEAVKNVIVAQTGKTWGRSRDIDFLTILISFSIMAFCPLLVIYFWMACDSFQCSLWAPIPWALEGAKNFDDVKAGLVRLVVERFPRPTPEGLQVYAGWLIFQALCYRFVPGKIGYGQMTPAGYKLPYIVNGLLVWFITHALFIALSDLTPISLFPSSIIHDLWGPLLISANIYGYLLTLFCYIKAYLFPSHPEDRKFSSSAIYDLYMGIEFNPRIGKWFDFKLFHNGRPGIVAWTLINFSFACAQYKRIGYVTNSMVLLNWLHFVYVIDFFYNEDWYLRTIDICHDHFGFYLSWGDSVWLPFMYTLQSHFLVRHPIDLSWPYFFFVFGLGMWGYYIFRAVNNQKDLVRRTDGDCKIWGKKAEVIRTSFVTSDGKEHKSLLLVSGFWGLSRHFNYVGDLAISTAMCLTCGFGYLLPYFYITFMTILLVGRVQRDQDRCFGKYGKYWEEYCRRVPYKLIPYVY
ncbi:hypothetical protein HK097_001406 [Rhizophlyctis rosea]|uniref:7-dehydrocholesterol reductase n=1 Tax=Rhizophlyctis rosea TaxID=64517 RepID=A0AAD5SJ98_9FUNG|nr:hypothetical protein HK097_001406 [Rhizophlyctis rosea]